MHLAKLLIEEKVPGIEYEKRRRSPPIQGRRPLTFLDICCGSGCISMLLHVMLRDKFSVKSLGIDISVEALKLANENMRSLPAKTRRPCSFRRMDIFQEPTDLGRDWDVVVANPPYISPDHFNKGTTRSVRNWEPKWALVPPVIPGEEKVDPDIFYRRIIQLNKDTFKSKILLMEVGDNDQARRVVEIALDIMGSQGKIEIWADAPAESARGKSRSWRLFGPKRTVLDRRGSHTIPVRGSGNYRTVVIYAPPSPSPGANIGETESAYTGDTL
jgi:methylase of polypeptide subunit release factors